MPFAYRIECPHAYGGVWKIEETVEELVCHIPQIAEDAQRAEKLFASPRRRLEYVAVRALIYTLLQKLPTILYKKSGKPFLKDQSLFLSVSHTSGYAAVLFSEDREVGIDIVMVSERVMKVRERFLASDEKPETLYDTLLHWSAKEAVFKIIDRENAGLGTHFHVRGLVGRMQNGENEVTRSGTFLLKYDGMSQPFEIYYQTTSDYVLTYVAS